MFFLKVFHKELSFLLICFSNNGFPRSVVYREINRFITKIMHPSVPIHSASKQKIYISMPYLGKHSDGLRGEVEKVVGKFFPQIDLRIICSNPNTIGSFFRFKDILPTMQRSSVVYEFCCGRCPSTTYVGSTIRPLYMRVAEHRGRSYRTGELLQKPPHSNIREHCLGSPHHYPADNTFKILGQAKNKISLRILESLHIAKTKPNLNNQQSAFPLQLVN